MSNKLLASFLLAATLAACATADSDEFGESQQGLSTYRRALFFSDENMTQMVGERSSLCTSTTNWGIRTPWVYNDSGSCEWEFKGPAEWPTGGGNCVCCYDTDGNGTCSGQDSPYFHICNDTTGC